MKHYLLGICLIGMMLFISGCGEVYTKAEADAMLQNAKATARAEVDTKAEEEEVRETIETPITQAETQVEAQTNAEAQTEAEEDGF